MFEIKGLRKLWSTVNLLFKRKKKKKRLPLRKQSPDPEVTPGHEYGWALITGPTVALSGVVVSYSHTRRLTGRAEVRRHSGNDMIPPFMFYLAHLLLATVGPLAARSIFAPISPLPSVTSPLPHTFFAFCFYTAALSLFCKPQSLVSVQDN